MSVLKVENLCKSYETFALKNVSFTLESGKITGFIGRNGAGKTTTLKSILGFLHTDDGRIYFDNKEFKENEFDIKQEIGYVSGGFSFYPTKKLKTITCVTKSFYDTWDDALYEKYMKMFKLDERKTPSKLSEGMKVKYSICLALSHHAKLLILDEPTSGLDPISRDELMDIFLKLQDSGTTILFSTHITSDLEKCADNIIYIQNGQIIAEDSIKNFVNSYKLVEFKNDPKYFNKISKSQKDNLFIGYKRTKKGYTALIKSEDAKKLLKKGDSMSPDNEITAFENDILEIKNADLETIMVHLEKED